MRTLPTRLFPSIALLLAAAALFSYATLLLEEQRQRAWLAFGSVHRESNFPQDTTEPQDALRSLLFPERHIHRPAQTIRLQWNVTTAATAPDGVRRTVLMVNDQFPGPTIEARSGDELEITVTNLADTAEGISIHWHGLAMRDANDMDGVVGLTQSAIPLGQSFTYRFRLDEEEHGTFWYHAHSGVQLADGLYGGLVVHQPAEQAGQTEAYDREQLLLIGDWYHRPAAAVLAKYLHYSNFGNDPAPDSLLINGRGHFDCSMAVPANPVDCQTVEAPVVAFHGQRTRLRVVNTGALTGFTLAVSGHAATMRVIEVDGGGPVDGAPAASSVGVLYPGERMDVVVERLADEASFVVALDRENLHFKNFALTSTQSFRLTWPSSVPASVSTPPSVQHFHLSDAVGPPVGDAMPPSVDNHAVLYTRIEIHASYGNVPLGVVNRTSWLVSKADAVAPPLIALDRTQWPHMRQPGEVPPLGEVVRDIPLFDPGAAPWIDLVINNLDEMSHPFHLHGFSFFVVAAWRPQTAMYAAYNPFASAAAAGGPLNVQSPVRKDTILVPRMGYVVLRVHLDHAGLWLLHCHTLWHHAAGMGIAVEVARR